MSILIKGMEMPKTCGKCKIKSAIDCDRWKHVRSIALDKHWDCPLVLVPPHGRCIDVDALIKELTLDDEDGNSGASLLMAIFLEVLKAAPTIFPADPAEGEA